MNADAQILRPLAAAFFEAAQAPRNAQRRALHFASNDLHMVRPVVQINEMPWNEMNIDGSLTLHCIDPFLRGIEDYMRKQLFQFQHFPADMIIPPYLPVHKVITQTSMGLAVQEDTVATNNANHIISHEYKDQLATDDSVDLLRDVTVSYDKTQTMSRYQLLGDMVGDLIPVRIKGVDHFTVVTWDNISRYRGVTPLLMDLVERPEFCHALVNRMTQIEEGVLQQYEDLGLFDSAPDYLHCTPILTKDMPGTAVQAGKPLTRKDIWGRGTAQIFASVGKAMHAEFDIDYMQRTIGTCGLSYYGCCEPLDKKIDIVEKLPNLRKISITPWADVDIAADAIGKRYVLSAKPNPASVAVGALNKDALKAEITKILTACKRNGCNVDITLKDISTCHNRPENIFEWEKMVMDMVESY